MAGAGRICSGFSLPYVALYENNNSTVTYKSGRRLARGVEVSVEANYAEDNNFFADNRAVESVPGLFTDGTATFTVDGLLKEAERFIMGMAEPETLEVGGKTVKVYNYGMDNNIPYVGVGFIVRYQSEGVITYEPTILCKARFNDTGLTARTQEEDLEWQTQEITATLLRDDSAAHNWKRTFEAQATEAEAEAILKSFFNVTEE